MTPRRAAVLLALLPAPALAGPHKPDYPPLPPDWNYHGLPPGPYLTTCYPFAGWPGYRGASGGFWTHGPGPHRPPVPVYGPIPTPVPNPDPHHVNHHPALRFGTGTYGWVGAFRASPRHLPYSVSVRPAAGGMSYAAPAAGSCLTLRVAVPAGAELFVDGVKTSQTGADRLFESPAGEAGREVWYDLTARWVENGAPVEQTRRVGGKAGETVRVEFAPAAAARR